MLTIYTIGAYGWGVDDFITLLARRGVDVLVDVRMRRGMRGSEYAWANSQRLQQRLRAVGIGYVHAKHLAPIAEVRALQHAADKDAAMTKRRRAELSEDFRGAYLRAILDSTSSDETAAWLARFGRAPALFCVERAPAGCHRSLIAEWLRREGQVSTVIHIGS